MKQPPACVITGFTNPSGEVVFRVSGWLDGRRICKNLPARDFGPRLAHAFLPIHGKGGSDWAYAWVPIVAPILGGVTGAQLFQFTGF